MPKGQEEFESLVNELLRRLTWFVDNVLSVSGVVPRVPNPAHPWATHLVEFFNQIAKVQSSGNSFTELQYQKIAIFFMQNLRNNVASYQNAVDDKGISLAAIILHIVLLIVEMNYVSEADLGIEEIPNFAEDFDALQKLVYCLAWCLQYETGDNLSVELERLDAFITFSNSFNYMWTLASTEIRSLTAALRDLAKILDHAKVLKIVMTDFFLSELLQDADARNQSNQFLSSKPNEAVVSWFFKIETLNELKLFFDKKVNLGSAIQGFFEATEKPPQRLVDWIFSYAKTVKDLKECLNDTQLRKDSLLFFSLTPAERVVKTVFEVETIEKLKGKLRSTIEELYSAEKGLHSDDQSSDSSDGESPIVSLKIQAPKRDLRVPGLALDLSLVKQNFEVVDLADEDMPDEDKPGEIVLPQPAIPQKKPGSARGFRERVTGWLTPRGTASSAGGISESDKASSGSQTERRPRTNSAAVSSHPNTACFDGSRSARRGTEGEVLEKGIERQSSGVKQGFSPLPPRANSTSQARGFNLWQKSQNGSSQSMTSLPLPSISKDAHANGARSTSGSDSEERFSSSTNPVDAPIGASRSAPSTPQNGSFIQIASHSASPNMGSGSPQSSPRIGSPLSAGRRSGSAVSPGSPRISDDLRELLSFFGYRTMDLFREELLPQVPSADAVKNQSFIAQLNGPTRFRLAAYLLKKADIEGWIDSFLNAPERTFNILVDAILLLAKEGVKEKFKKGNGLLHPLVWLKIAANPPHAIEVAKVIIELYKIESAWAKSNSLSLTVDAFCESLNEIEEKCPNFYLICYDLMSNEVKKWADNVFEDFENFKVVVVNFHMFKHERSKPVEQRTAVGLYFNQLAEMQKSFADFYPACFQLEAARIPGWPEDISHVIADYVQGKDRRAVDDLVSTILGAKEGELTKDFFSAALPKKETLPKEEVSPAEAASSEGAASLEEESPSKEEGYVVSAFVI
ncbi:MAG: hypothetical protein JSS53_05460 [Proteobacteria bacterium]|nr:hypothetical protein [Pseudomonadota bacterium]